MSSWDILGEELSFLKRRIKALETILSTGEGVEVFNKANLVNGKVPLAELPPVYFSGLEGDGSFSNPFRFTGSTTPTTPTPTPPATGSGTAVTQFQYLAGVTQSTNNLTVISQTDGGAAAIQLGIQSGVNDAWIEQTYKFAEPTGVMMLGVGLDPYYGTNDALAYINALDNGKILYKGGETAAGAVTVNGRLRIRTTASSVIMEYTNNGTDYITLNTVTRDVGVLRSKLGFGGNQVHMYEIKQSGLS